MDEEEENFNPFCVCVCDETGSATFPFQQHVAAATCGAICGF